MLLVEAGSEWNISTFEIPYLEYYLASKTGRKKSTNELHIVVLF